MSLISLHRYLGLFLCLVVLSISLTGTLLLWKKEYLWLTFDDARHTIDTELLAGAIEKIESSYGSDEVIFIQLHSEDLALHKVFLSERRYAWHNQQGDALQVWQRNERIEDWLLDLHHQFLLGNTIGLNIAGVAGILLMPLILLGLLIWWPRRQTLKRGILPKSTQRGALLGSHGNIGAIFSMPSLLLALTGVILVYPTQARWVFLSDTSTHISSGVSEQAFVNADGIPAWSAMLELAYRAFPESQIRSVRPASSKYSSRKVSVQQKQGWHRLGRSSVEVSAAGTLSVVDALQQTLRKRVFSFSYPLHTAKLGLVYKLFLSLVGLALALLSGLGLCAFVQGKRR